MTPLCLLVQLGSALRAIPSVVAAVQRQSDQLERLTIMVTETQAMIARLQADVAANTQATAAANTLLAGLTGQLNTALAAASAAGATDEQLQDLTALSATLESNTTALSAAVTANTPVAPPATAARTETAATDASTTTDAPDNPDAPPSPTAPTA